MFYYTIRDAATGALIAEGTAEDLVEKGLYKSKASVSNSFGRWHTRKKKGVKTKLTWTRTGDVGRGVQQTTGRTEARIHSDRVRSWKEKAARQSRQGKIAADSKPRKPTRYTTEKLGDIGALPEHAKKFAQPLKEPPVEADPLRWDIYELECLNWKRRQEGKRPLTYGEWKAGIR